MNVRATWVHRLLSFCIFLLTGVLGLCAVVSAQSSGKPAEWPTYGGDFTSTRYRPFDQIDASNFDKLEVAWRFKTDNLGNRPEYQLGGTR